MKTLKKISIYVSTSLMLGLMCSLSLTPAPLSIAIPSYNEESSRAFKEMVAEFTRTHPNIPIDIELGNWETWHSTVTSAFKTGDPADIIFTRHSSLATYVKSNHLVPLDSLLSQQELALFPPSLLAKVRWEGKLYALPSTLNVRTLYVNTGLLKRVAAQAPTTWEGIYEIAKRITETTDAYGFGIPGKEAEIVHSFLDIAWNMGGGILAPSAAGQKSILASAQSIRAAEFLYELIDKGYTQPAVTAYDSNALMTLFLRNKLAMMIAPGNLSKALQQANPDTAFIQLALPSSRKDQKSTTLGVLDVVHISKLSTNQADALQFLIYSFKLKHQTAWTSRAGLIPAPLVARHAQVRIDPTLKIQLDLLPQTRIPAPHPLAPAITSTIAKGLQAIYNEQILPEVGMKKLHQRLTPILK